MSANTDIEQRIRDAQARIQEASKNETARVADETRYLREKQQAEAELQNLRYQAEQQQLQDATTESQGMAEVLNQRIAVLIERVEKHDHLDSIISAFDDALTSWQALYQHNVGSVGNGDLLGNYPLFKRFSWGIHPEQAILGTLKGMKDRELQIRTGIAYIFLGQILVVGPQFDAAQQTERGLTANLVHRR